MSDEQGERTLRELDGQLGRPKGTAFRAFKQLAHGFRENEDYRLLDPVHDAAKIAQLRAQGRLYATGRAVLLLGPVAAARVLARMRTL